MVENIHKIGGNILGTSKDCSFDIEKFVNELKIRGIN